LPGDVQAPVQSAPPSTAPEALAATRVARREGVSRASGLQTVISAGVRASGQVPPAAARAPSHAAVAASPSGTRERLTGVTIAGKYHVLEMLGSGGMGQVYKARHLTLDTLVCVKVLRPSLAEDAELLAASSARPRAPAD